MNFPAEKIFFGALPPTQDNASDRRIFCVRMILKEKMRAISSRISKSEKLN
jgi:hypothetical protein